MHPNAAKKYKENDYEIALERAEDINERVFFEKAQAAKQPVTREIMAIYRIKKGKEEFFWYGEEIRSHDQIGNPIDHYRTVGKYQDPSFRYQMDTEGKKVASEIQSLSTVYEYNWPSDFTPELESLVSETPSLVVITPSRKYGGFTFEDFKEKSFDDLVTLGRFGTLNPVIVSELKKGKTAAVGGGRKL